MLSGEEILLLGIPSIFQIGLTALRVKGRTRLPIIVTFVLSLILGILISRYLSNKLSDIYKENSPHEYGVGTLTFLGTLLWTVFSTSIIGIIGGLLYHEKAKQFRQLSKNKP